jgi:hypothetical protein
MMYSFNHCKEKGSNCAISDCLIHTGDISLSPDQAVHFFNNFNKEATSL